MKNMDYNIRKHSNDFRGFRIQLIEDLPSLLDKAISDYKDVAMEQSTNDIKSFAAHQAACRTALTHLQLLVKLAAWAEDATDGEMASDVDNSLDTLIFEARAALQDQSK